MYHSIEQTRKVAARSAKTLQLLSAEINKQKMEHNADTFYLTYARNALSTLPKLSRKTVETAMQEMETAGYIFTKKQSGSTLKYVLTTENIIDIYHHRGEQRYRDRYQEALVVFVSSLKGGVSKTVTTATLAHALRVHPQLIIEDLRILCIDMDPQASATMFLNHNKSIGVVDATSAQAMLLNVSREELLNDFIVPSIVPGVDVMPASLEDGFIASEWKTLCAEHLPDQNIYTVLRNNIIDKLSADYDLIFIDCGPHLDDFLLNSIAAADVLMTPITPPQVDFHSTLKYLTRLPELLQKIEDSGAEIRFKANIGFMSKVVSRRTKDQDEDKQSHSWARQIFGGGMLDAMLPRLDGFERSGESFDTVITANPATYDGSVEALRNARAAAESFAKAVFDRIEYIRTNE